MFSASGVMKCAPGYRVPASVPLVWLTRTPPVPLGTTTIPRASRIGPQASRASANGARQRTSGSSGIGPGPVPAVASDFWCWVKRYRSCESMEIAAAIIPAPPNSSKYFMKIIRPPFQLTLLRFDFCQLRREEQTEDLPENQFFDHQSHCYREDQSCDDGHECN